MLDTPERQTETLPALRELQSLMQWCDFKLELRAEGDEKLTKVPYHPRNYKASSSKSATWTTHEKALYACQSTKLFSGIGFFFNGQVYSGIDIDDCVDEHGNIAEWAWKIIRMLDSYAEYSTSGTGVHIVVKGLLQEKGLDKDGIEYIKGRKNNPSVGDVPKGKLELYSERRFFVVTGNHVPGTPTMINERQGQLLSILNKFFVEPKEEKQREFYKKSPKLPDNYQPAEIPQDDHELWQIIFREKGNGTKSERLYYGDASDYMGDDGRIDESAADAAMAAKLVFYTQRDPSRVERMMWQTGLVRDKWTSHPTYLKQLTIDNAMRLVNDNYDPLYHHKKAIEKQDHFMDEIGARQHTASDQESNQNGKAESDSAKKEGKEYIPSRKEHKIFAKEVPLKKIREYLEMNEYGDGLLFAEVFHDQLLYDASEKKWYLWGGHHWKPDNTGYIKTLVSGYLGAVYLRASAELNIERAKIDKERASLEDGKKKADISAEDQVKIDRLKNRLGEIDDEMEMYTKRAKSLRRATYNKNVLYFAMSEPTIAITGEKWDSNPWLLGVVNGVIELKTGECRDGRPDDYIRSVCPTEWAGLDTSCPRFEQFLQEIFDDRPHDVRHTLVSFFKRLFGYSVTGLSKEAIFPIFYGEEGRNGKDTLFGIMQRVLGTAIADAISNDCIISNDKYRTGGAPSPHLMDLQGKRIVWGSETKKGDKVNVSQIKQLTGGGRISGRRLNENQRSFAPTHTLFLMTNDKPVVGSRDKAFWERACMIKFGIRFVDNPKESNERKKDAFLGEKLDKEASGILALLVRGCLEYQEQGLNRPDDISESTKEYRESEDLTLQFITERCVCREGAKAGVTKLWEEYSAWCKNNHVHSTDGVSFKKDIEKRFPKKHERTGWVYLGIGIIDLNSPEPPKQGNFDYDEQDNESSTNSCDETRCHSVTGCDDSSQSCHTSVYEPVEPIHSPSILKCDGCDAKTQVGPRKEQKNNKISEPIEFLRHTRHTPNVNQPVEPNEDGVTGFYNPVTARHTVTSGFVTPIATMDHTGVPEEHRSLYVDYSQKVDSLPVSTPTWQAPNSGHKNTMFGKNEHKMYTRSLLRSGEVVKINQALEAMKRTLVPPLANRASVVVS